MGDHIVFLLFIYASDKYTTAYAPVSCEGLIHKLRVLADVLLLYIAQQSQPG